MSSHCLPWIFALWEARCHLMRQPLGEASVARSWVLYPISSEELRPADIHVRKLGNRSFRLTGAWQLDCHLLRHPNVEPHSWGACGSLTQDFCEAMNVVINWQILSSFGTQQLITNTVLHHHNTILVSTYFGYSWTEPLMEMRMPEVYWRELSGHPLVLKRKRNRSEQKGEFGLWYNRKKASDEPVEHAETEMAIQSYQQFEPEVKSLCTCIH